MYPPPPLSNWMIYHFEKYISDMWNNHDDNISPLKNHFYQLTLIYLADRFAFWRMIWSEAARYPGAI